MPRPYAVFDIDGTLIRWQLYHALADALAKKGVIDRSAYSNVMNAKRNWRTRRTLNSFSDYEKVLIKLIDSSLPEIDYLEFKEACAGVVEHYRDQVYTYTRNLIADIRQKNYLTFAISASPAELVSLVADYYSFDDYAGSEYLVDKGKLNGEKKTAAWSG